MASRFATFTEYYQKVESVVVQETSIPCFCRTALKGKGCKMTDPKNCNKLKKKTIGISQIIRD